jgi:hypothetical protein
MTRTILLLVILLSSCAVETPVSVANLTEPQRTRVVHYGMTAVELAGMTGAHVVNFIANKAGAPVEKVRDKLKELRGRLGRDPDSLRKERAALIVANADATRVDAAFIAGLCKPLADEGDDVALAACQSRQAGSFAHRLCRVSNGNFVAVGTRLPLTEWQSANIRGQIQALNPAPTIIVIRDDTQQKWDDTLANPGQGLPPLRTCNEGG